MAINVNKVILCGRLGKDPEHKGEGDGFVTFSLATSRSWRDERTGDKVERTEWHQIVVFNKVCAKFAREYMKKGDMAYLEGRLETRKYEKDGVEKYVIEVIVPPYEGVLQSVGKDRNGESRKGEGTEADYSKGSGTGQPRQEESRSSGSRPSFSRELDDEIPFAPEWR